MSDVNSTRLFQCTLCHCQTLICSHCDHGNQYCSPDCSRKARRKSLRRANQKYSRTRKGRHNNAERQRRFRQRKTEKVTDQGSGPTVVPVLLPLLVKTPVLNTLFPVIARSLSRICHFCLARISDFIRNDFLHRQTIHRRW